MIRRVEEADMETEQWLYSDTNPSRHYYNVPITATDRNRLWGLQAKKKKKCEFSSRRHCRKKTNMLSTATFRNFAKQGRWELHCPCHLSSAGKNCWMQEASLAGSLGPTTRRTSVTTQGNSRPMYEESSRRPTMWQSLWMGNKGGTLCSALPQGGGTESHRGDAGMRGGQAKSSVLMGGRIISPAWRGTMEGTMEATPNAQFYS